MPYEEVSEPISGKEAFRQFDGAAVQSQAAFLLLLGIQAGSDSEEAQEKKLSDIISEEDRGKFSFPPLLPSPRELFAGEDIRTSLTRGYLSGDESWEKISSEQKQKIIPDLIDDFYRKQTRQAAAELMKACLFHRDPLVRVAAAASHVELSSEWGRPISILEQGTHEQDSLVRDVAATALARIIPDHPRLAELATPIPINRDGEPSHTSLLVHGTWVRNFSWWQPGGDFHSYLLNNVRDDLYGDNDVFSWSGLYNDSARQLGAQDLIDWVERHDMNGLEHLFAHSHGGSVATLASQAGLDIGKLVLLSCPVHDNYLPDFDNVDEVVSIHVRLDLVVLVDRGRQKYKHPKIREHVLPVWFNHSATHDPNVWQRHNIPALL